MNLKPEFKHFIIHKPKGYLSQFIYEGKRKGSKKLLGELSSFPSGTMAIGRLDEKSEGLLLLTTDGMESENVRSSKVEKEYFVQVDGLITNIALEELMNGLEIGILGKKYFTKPCLAKKIEHTDIKEYPIEIVEIRDPKHGPTSWISITLNEGKFRQIRKMTAKVGFPTLRLIRVRIGTLKLNIPIGGVKEINQIEVF